MKASLIFLTLFGLVAAVCAAVLVRTVLSRPAPNIAVASGDSEVTLLIAAKPLKAMTVVDAAAITTKTVRKSELPAGSMTNSVQVVGKVLTRPMVEGEVFAPSCFANEGLGLYLAAALPRGKRAFSITLRDHTSMAGILYPGSVVDVIVSLQAEGEARSGVSTTLLQGIQVIGIGSQTVASDQEFKDKNPGALATKGQTNHRMVTLLVTPKQAEILQLATEYGTVALTMRNPLDDLQVAQDVTRMSDFSGASKGLGLQMASWATAFLRSRPTPARAGETGSDPFAAAAGPSTQPSRSSNPLWEMLVVRGNNSEKRSFPLSAVDQELSDEAEQPEPEPAANIPPSAASAKG
jgi:pilus assembly protein CpaB